jgi:polyisoprenoid-binding protein YceI
MSAQPRNPALLAAVLLLPALLSGGHLHAQQGQRHELLAESRVWVDGTSNREDWTVDATEIHGYVVLERAGASLNIREGRFTVAARRIVSKQGVIMDRLTHGALRANAHPDITYELASAAALPSDAATARIATKGRATIAGVTKDIEQDVQVERLADGRLRFTGSSPVLMSDFDMTPPTAMFGALRTGNRVVVNFELFVRP